MRNKMFVNLPVKDLNRSVEFWKKLGYEFDPKFTDENATCMLVGEDAYVMLLVEPFFKGFTPKPIADARRSSEVLLALSLGSREEVDRLVQNAVAGGGRKYKEPEDRGFMYGSGFEDPDGHLWECFWMDPSALER